MKLKWMALLGLAFALIPVQGSAQQPSAPTTPKEKASYLIGVDVAGSIKSQGIDIDVDTVIRGLRDALEGTKLAMSDAELRATMMELQQTLKQKQAEAARVAGERNKELGQIFLAENAKKEGVVSLPSGLQYKIITAAEGSKPKLTDTVVCNYRGTLIDGTEFDASGAQPATFEIAQVIPGFKEALQLMNVGSKWQFFIPAELAYGERGAGNAIEPNATLVFEIELVSIK